MTDSPVPAMTGTDLALGRAEPARVPVVQTQHPSAVPAIELVGVAKEFHRAMATCRP